MLTRLGESYGKGAKKENERRRSNSNAPPRPGTLDRSGQALGSVFGASSSSRRLTEEEVSRFGELEEVPLQEDEDEWDSLYGDT